MPHQNGRHTWACFGPSVTYLPEWEEKKDKKDKNERTKKNNQSEMNASKLH